MKRSEYQIPAIKVAIYFFIFGFLWILFTDNLLDVLQLSTKTAAKLQTFKGWLFVTLTTLLIYFLVTQRLKEVVKLKNKLQLSEKSLSVILENIGEGIISVDKNKTITAMNSIAEKLTGISFELAQNRPIDEVLKIFNHESNQNITTALFNNPVTLNSHNNNFSLVDSGNKAYKIILSIGQIREKAQQPVSTIVAFRDITEKKKLENELLHWLKIYSSFIKYAIEGIYLFEFEKPIDVNLPEEEQVKLFFDTTILKTCNDSFAKMYGYNNADELNGINMRYLHGSSENLTNRQFFTNLIKSDYRLLQEITEEISKTGELIMFSNNVVGIIEDHHLVRVWGNQIDITNQIKARKILEESEKKYKLLFQTTPVPLIIYDLENFTVLDNNHSAEILYGYTNEEFIKLKIWDIRPDLALFSPNELRRWIMDNMRKTTEYITISKSGKTIYVEIKRDLIDYLGKPAVLVAINDISAIKEAEKKVIQSLVEGENNERKRISKELHDSLGQNLTAASLNFNAIKNTVSNLDPQKAEKFFVGLDFLNTAIEESRNIAHNLMPKAIEDFGLVPSLNSFFNQIDKSSGIKIKFYENLAGKRLPLQVEFNLYRITQEAMNNAIKHAHASEIFVQLILHQNDLIYTFEDDGKGFDVKKAELSNKGMGVTSINNRVKAMSGSLEIDSSPKKGTAITIELPV